MRELAIVFVSSPLSVWDAFLVEASSGRAVDGRNTTAVSLLESLFILTLEHRLELIVLRLWITVDGLVRDDSAMSVD